jgi:hypothetical protein
LSLLLTQAVLTLRATYRTVDGMSLMAHKSTAILKIARILAAALGMVRCLDADATPAADAEFSDARAGSRLYGYFREAHVPMQWLVSLDEIRGHAGDIGYVLAGGEARQPIGLSTGSTAGVAALPPQYQYRPAGGSASSFSGPSDTSQPDPPARFHHDFGSGFLSGGDGARGDRREVLLRDSGALVRAKLRLTLGKEWLFVYGDMGPADSTLGWQGLVGIRIGHGANLVGGWRHVTYYFSPGRDFDSLDSDGPFLGAQRAW